MFDWTLEGDTPFVVMEYFPSGSLRDVMPLQGAIEEEAIWRLLADLLLALDVAHRASLLHLDIKPANVLLDGNAGYVLTDFGVSQASRIERGLLPFSVGSRGYQAPEQKEERFDQYDLRTDLWGVGATAWAMATGLNLAERSDLVREDDGNAIYGLPPLSEFRINLSPELEEVIMSLLHLDPSLRPGSVAEGFCAAVRPSLVLGTFIPTAALTAVYCAQSGNRLVGLIIALAVFGVTHLASTLLGRRLGGQSLSTIFAVSLLAQITFLLAYLVSSARV